MRASLILLASFLILTACAEFAPEPADTSLRLTPASYDALPGWNEDAMAQALPAMRKSCARIMKAPGDKSFGPLPQAGTYMQWQSACLDLQAVPDNNDSAFRAFLERHFQPYQVSAGNDPEGLFTGYYEASLNGSKTRHGIYQTPLYLRPEDLVMVNLGEFRPELKGQRIAGRVIEGQLKPYEDRAAIVAGAWPHNDLALVWVDDPIDAFFVQVQGSGVVQMDDGSVLRIGYAGQNGHIYYAVGKELVKRGEMKAEEVSLQSIRAWLKAHPDQLDGILNTNRSYVFFKQLDGDGPLGAEGVALTPERSLAVDHALLPYGMPLFLATDNPKLGRLMMAQDTGGAITGAVRGDVFWGYGARAEAIAGPMKSQGRYWVLLPK